jgi:hypothetical protein
MNLTNITVFYVANNYNYTNELSVITHMLHKQRLDID